MSLITHPDALIVIAPAPNNASILKSGRQPFVAASAILHVQGKYRSHVPMGLSNRIRFKYGFANDGLIENKLLVKVL